MVRCRDGETGRWRDGEMEGWRDGEMERWRDGEMVRRGDGEMERWSDGEMVRRGDGEMERWGDGEMERWRNGEELMALRPVSDEYKRVVDGEDGHNDWYSLPDRSIAFNHGTKATSKELKAARAAVADA